MYKNYKICTKFYVQIMHKNYKLCIKFCTKTQKNYVRPTAGYIKGRGRKNL